MLSKVKQLAESRPVNRWQSQYSNSAHALTWTCFPHKGSISNNYSSVAFAVFYQQYFMFDPQQAVQWWGLAWIHPKPNEPGGDLLTPKMLPLLEFAGLSKWGFCVSFIQLPPTMPPINENRLCNRKEGRAQVSTESYLCLEDFNYRWFHGQDLLASYNYAFKASQLPYWYGNMREHSTTDMGNRGNEICQPTKTKEREASLFI